MLGEDAWGPNRFSGQLKHTTNELVAPAGNIRSRSNLYQEWFSAYSKEEEKSPLRFSGSSGLTGPVHTVAAAIRRTLDWPENLFSTVHFRPDYLRAIIDICETAGITVTRSGVVGNNTHRKLNISEFRGFALCDEYSPYDNGGESPLSLQDP